MIEWWQAFLISVPSALLASLLTAGVALLVQHRQHRHDIEMQKGRLDAEAAARRIQARSDARRERLRPIFDDLLQLEETLGYRFVRSGAEVLKTGTEQVASQQEVVDAVDNWLKSAPDPLSVATRLLGYSTRIDDTAVRDKLTVAAGAILNFKEEDRRWLLDNLGDVNDQLEKYVLQEEDEENR